jgi:arylsulfatase A-like enzyme
MKNIPGFFLLWMAAPVTQLSVAADQADSVRHKPNVLILYADDLGYGDPHCYNPERGKIPTPAIDKLAAQGMRFTDAHSSSGVCTPSRYSLLTGRYHWRTVNQAGVLNGASPPLLSINRVTLASLVAEHGYRTACFGKWHLGLRWAHSDPANAKPDLSRIDYAQPITDGPLQHGFQSFFGISASLDMPPYVWIENDRATELPTAQKSWYRKGMGGPRFEATEVLPALVRKTSDFFATQAAGGKGGAPFFLYLPLTAPHTPLAVNAEWRGRSGLNSYADFVMETDAAIGRILDALERSGLAESTLVVLSSDNGCASYAGLGDQEREGRKNARKHGGSPQVLPSGVQDLESRGHYPSGPLRGYKADAWEGGHRVPFIVRWPRVVQPGTVCDQLVLQADLMRTFAEILGVPLPDDAGEDSFSFLPLLRGENAPIRTHAVATSNTGLPGVRSGPWKYIAGPEPAAGVAGQPQPVQLYNLAEDLAESKNLAGAMPGKVAELQALLEKLITEGRSTPGAPQKNDAEVVRHPKSQRRGERGDQADAAGRKEIENRGAAHPGGSLRNPARQVAVSPLCAPVGARSHPSPLNQ